VGELVGSSSKDGFALGVVVDRGGTVGSAPVGGLPTGEGRVTGSRVGAGFETGDFVGSLTMMGLGVGGALAGSVANIGALVKGRPATMEGGMLGGKVGPVVGVNVGRPPRAGEPGAIVVSGMAVGMPPPVMGELDAPVTDGARLVERVGLPAPGPPTAGLPAEGPPTAGLPAEGPPA
jgi:hypothetical protein